MKAAQRGEHALPRFAVRPKVFATRDHKLIISQMVEDARRDYGEARLRVMAWLDGRLHAAVVTPRGADLRIISFRKANRREVRR